MIIGETITIDLLPEGDEYGIVHNHFDCPNCGKCSVPTDHYYDLYQDSKYYSGPHPTLICDECGAVFQYVDDLDKIYWKGKWKRIV